MGASFTARLQRAALPAGTSSYTWCPSLVPSSLKRRLFWSEPHASLTEVSRTKRSWLELSRTIPVLIRPFQSYLKIPQYGCHGSVLTTPTHHQACKLENRRGGGVVLRPDFRSALHRDFFSFLGAFLSLNKLSLRQCLESLAALIA